MVTVSFAKMTETIECLTHMSIMHFENDETLFSTKGVPDHDGSARSARLPDPAVLHVLGPEVLVAQIPPHLALLPPGGPASVCAYVFSSVLATRHSLSKSILLFRFAHFED